jgi:hypothetical protein
VSFALAWNKAEDAFGPTYIHSDRENHELGIEADEGTVLGETMLLHKPDLDRPQEIPVQSRIDYEDQYFGYFIPEVVDLHEYGMDGWNGMRRYPDDEDGDVDRGD